jgi:hypothetical protein
LPLHDLSLFQVATFLLLNRVWKETGFEVHPDEEDPEYMEVRDWSQMSDEDMFTDANLIYDHREMSKVAANPEYNKWLCSAFNKAVEKKATETLEPAEEVRNMLTKSATKFLMYNRVGAAKATSEDNITLTTDNAGLGNALAGRAHIFGDECL